MPTEFSNGERLRQRWATARHTLRAALGNFLHEESLMISASIAYHSLLAIFPLLLLLLGLSGIYIRRFGLAGHLSVVLQRYLPVRTDFIMQNLVGISRSYGKISLISFLLLFWSSSGVFVPVEKALNRAWDVRQGRPWWRSRLLALEMACVVGCLILISAGLVAAEFLFRNWLGHMLAPSFHPLVVFIYHLLTASSSFGIALLGFLLLFQRLPYRAMRLGHAFPGALLTALLWEVARKLFTFFLIHSNFRQVYGSIGAVVALMTWVYISSAVMLFGAQVSHALYGSLEPASSPALAGEPLSTTPAGSG